MTLGCQDLKRAHQLGGREVWLCSCTQHNSGQLKCVCGTCGYLAYTTRSWLDLAGAPRGPKHDQMKLEKTLSIAL